jgi:hypothetical protein
VFISACNEFLFLESVRQKPAPKTRMTEDADDEEQILLRQIETILAEQTDASGYMLASVLKDVLTRLRPDFNERSFGHSLFGRLLVSLEEKYGFVMVCLLMNKEEDRATYQFVVFNTKTREIIEQWTNSGSALGIGLKNYWSISIYNAIKKTK